MKGTQGRCLESHKRVCDLPAEQGIKNSSSRITLVVAHSIVEMEKCVDGLYNRTIEGTRKRLIYVVVDQLMKFSHFFVISFDYSGSQVVELFREVFRLDGLPKYIVSD